MSYLTHHFTLLSKTLTELNTLEKSGRIFDCDESDISVDAHTGSYCMYTHAYPESKCLHRR